MAGDGPEPPSPYGFTGLFLSTSSLPRTISTYTAAASANGAAVGRAARSLSASRWRVARTCGSLIGPDHFGLWRHCFATSMGAFGTLHSHWPTNLKYCPSRFSNSCYANFALAAGLSITPGVDYVA
jgi:putative spermidine/putrescine transport system permease protein